MTFHGNWFGNWSGDWLGGGGYAPIEVRVSWLQFNVSAAPVDVKASWLQFDTAASPADVRVSWLQFDTAAPVVEVRVSWLQFDTAATTAAATVYGGKKRRIHPRAVDDLTVEHVLNHWDYIDQERARNAASQAKKAIDEASKRATALKPDSFVSVPSNAAPTSIVFKGVVPLSKLALQRADLDAAAKLRRKDDEEALILMLLAEEA